MGSLANMLSEYMNKSFKKKSPFHSADLLLRTPVKTGAARKMIDSLTVRKVSL